MRSDGVAAALGYLRDGIVAGRFTPGEKLNQEDIAQALGMSRIPVREALGILAAEGAVEYVKNRGYTVPKISVELLDEIYRMRTLLESDLLRHIHQPSPEEIRDLNDINDRMREAADSGNLADFVPLNRRFHFAVFELGDAPLMTKMIDRLWTLSESYRALYLYDSRNAARSWHEHRELIEALESMDLERCVSISDAHRRSAQDHVRGFLLARQSPAHSIP
ncbi:GntR family transcriptional regulator [Prauserella flavalba]|nr:GntR family transcriptional regulator [Prauserella flavalba]